VPYMLVVGDEEERSEGVSVRRHGEGDRGLMDVRKFADQLRDENQRG